MTEGNLLVADSRDCKREWQDQSLQVELPASVRHKAKGVRSLISVCFSWATVAHRPCLPMNAIVSPFFSVALAVLLPSRAALFGPIRYRTAANRLVFLFDTPRRSSSGRRAWRDSRDAQSRAGQSDSVACQRTSGEGWSLPSDGSLLHRLGSDSRLLKHRRTSPSDRSGAMDHGPSNHCVLR